MRNTLPFDDEPERDLEERPDKDLSGMVRFEDHPTSVQSAEKLAPKLRTLQKRVIEAFLEQGRLTDQQLERLPQFSRYAYSTVRKRRSELFQAKIIVEDGVEKNDHGFNMIAWVLAEPDAWRRKVADREEWAAK